MGNLGRAGYLACLPLVIVVAASVVAAAGEISGVPRLIAGLVGLIGFVFSEGCSRVLAQRIEVCLRIGSSESASWMADDDGTVA